MEDAAEHRGLEVRAYATKGPWRRKDLALVAAMGPVFLSVGWQTARFVGLLAGVGATVALGALVLLLEFWLVEFYCWARLDVRQDPSNAELCVVKPRHAQTRRAHKCKLTACEDSGEVSFSFWNARYVLDKKSGIPASGHRQPLLHRRSCGRSRETSLVSSRPSLRFDLPPAELS